MLPMTMIVFFETCARGLMHVLWLTLSFETLLDGLVESSCSGTDRRWRSELYGNFMFVK